jgi:hypothetical protein
VLNARKCKNEYLKHKFNGAGKKFIETIRFNKTFGGGKIEVYEGYSGK